MAPAAAEERSAGPGVDGAERNARGVLGSGEQMPRDLRNRMWAEALDLLDQAERMQRTAFRLGRARPRTACW